MMGHGKLQWNQGRKRLGSLTMKIVLAMLLVMSFGNEKAHSAGVNYYVDIQNGSDTGDGSQTNPWRTLHGVFDPVHPKIGDGDTLYVMPGVYSSETEGVDAQLEIQIPNVQIIGICWPEIRFVYEVEAHWTAGFQISAAGITVEGFKITGFEFGIYAADQSPTMRRNIIFGMLVSGIHVESTNSSISPRIENNLIYDCGSSGILISGNNKGGTPEIFHNTIDAGVSGYSGTGISIYEVTTPISSIWPYIGFNIITNFNSGTGIFNADADIVEVFYNNVFANGSNYGGTGGFVVANPKTEDPKYQDPSVGNYRLQYSSPCIDAIPDDVSFPDPVVDDLLLESRPINITGIDNHDPPGGLYDMGAYEKTGDADRDGYSYVDEISNGTDPDEWDTDGDGYHDKEDTDPNDSGNHPTYVPGEYYVDANQTWRGLGTQAEPWQDIHLAIHHINNGTAGTESTPYIIHVAAGTYSADCCPGNWEPDEPLIITQSWVLIQGVGKNATIIDGTVCGAGPYGPDWMDGFILEGADHVTIRDMNIQNFCATGGSSGVNMRGATNCVVAACRIHGNDFSGVNIGMDYFDYTPSDYNAVKDGCEIFHNGYAGVYIGNSSYNEVRDNSASIYDNGTVESPGIGVSISGYSDYPAHGNQIVNNRIYSSVNAEPAQEKGVYVEGDGDGNIVEGNEIDGHVLGSACGIYTNNADVQILRNTLRDNGTGVIIEGNYSNNIAPSVINNLIYRSNSSLPDVFDGIYLLNSSGNGVSPIIYHNTIDGGAQYGIYIYSESGTTSPEIKYNIISNFEYKGIYNVGGIPVIDYNDVFNNLEYNYLGCSAGPNDLDPPQDPAFIDRGTGDYHLGVASPCIDVIPLSSVTLDHDSITRPQGAGYDIGVYEYPSAPAPVSTITGIPDTGQTACYDNTGEKTCPDPGAPFYGQDSQYQPQHPRSYTKLGAGGVELDPGADHIDDGGPWIMTRDNVTGLIWELKTAGNVSDKYDWTSADTYAEDLALGGFTDWRVPTIKELRYLIDHGRSGPAIDPWFWVDDTSLYWSSTTDANDSNYAWLAGFGGSGTEWSMSKTGNWLVLAVHGETPGVFEDGTTSGRMVVNVDNTVTDTATGLMWQRSSGPISDWQDALALAEGLVLDDYSDWRLPNFNELGSIVNFMAFAPAIDFTIFPSTAASYWTSTTDASDASNARLVNFATGGASSADKEANFNAVRAVRGGQFSSSGELVIFSPVQGGQYSMGDVLNISWDPGTFVGSVIISFSTDGGGTSATSWIEIAATENDGLFSWIPSGTPTVNGVVRIQDADSSAFAELGFFSLVESSIPIMPGTYYVDSTNGSDAKDGLSWSTAWQTLYNSITLINGGEPGTYTLNVADGTYTVTGGSEPDLDLNITQSNLTIIAAGTGAIVDGTGGTTGGWYDGFDVQGPATGVKIQNLKIQNFAANGIHMGGAVNCTVDACIIRNNAMNGILIEQGGDPWSASADCTIQNGCEIYENGTRGILIDTATGIIVDACRIYENSNDGIYIGQGANHRIRNNCEIFNNLYHGISIYESSGNQILNNRGSIYDNGNPSYNICGIYIDGPDSVNNLIQGSDVYSSGPGGDYFQEAGVRLVGVGSGNQVIGNTIFGHQADELNGYDGFGIEAVNCSPDIFKNVLYDNAEAVVALAEDGGTASPKIWNNLMYGDFTASTMRAGIMLEIEYSQFSDVIGTLAPLIFHNTIDGAAEAGIEIDVDTLYGGGGTPEIEYNNITRAGLYGIANTSGFADPAVTRNNIWNTGPSGTAYYQNFAVPPAGDIYDDPLYVDAGVGDFQLQAESTCIDFSTVGTSPVVSEDILAATRPQGGKFDIGCYETLRTMHTLTYTAGPHGSITGEASQTVEHGADGTSVTAVADEGYHFVQWSDGSTADLRTDTNVTDNISVTAEFAINTYALTYTAGLHGSITGETSQSVEHGADGTSVTAVADEGYHFVQWSDGSTASLRTDINVTDNISVTAEFAINTYALTYTAGLHGSITGEASQTVEHGADGTSVTAVADEGYHFVQWSDGSTADLRTDTNVTGNISVTAIFTITYSLTTEIYPSDAGTVTSDPAGIDCPATVCAASFVQDEVIALTATDGGFMTFAYWIVNGGTNRYPDNPLTVTMDTAYSVTAVFSPFDGGIGTSDDPFSITTPDQLAAVDNYPDSHFRLDANISLGDWQLTPGWTPIGTPTDPFVGVFDGNCYRISELFIDRPGQDFVGFFGYLGDGAEVRNLLILDADINGYDAVGVLTGKNDGGIISVCAATGTVRGHGSGTGGVGGLVGYNGWQMDNSYAAVHVTGTGDHIGGLAGKNHAGTIENCYSSGFVEGVGDVGGLVGMVYPGTVISSYWNTDTSGQSSSGGGNALLSTEMRLQSNFVEWDFTNTWAVEMGDNDFPWLQCLGQVLFDLNYAAGDNGSVDMLYQSLRHGQDGAPVTATGDSGYAFYGWSDGSFDNPRKDLSVTHDISVAAAFAVAEYTLTYTAGANGSVIGTSPQTVEHGADGTSVTAVADEGYHFVQWSDGSTADLRTDTNVTDNISVTAEFAINTYALTYTAGLHGSITGEASQTVEHGADGTSVTAVADEGYHFVQWSDGSTASLRTDINVTDNISVTAEFAINTYALTYTAGLHGSITGEASQTVEHGADGTSVTAVADEGYHFVQWSDGSTADLRTDTNVTGNISVTAIFTITYSLTTEIYPSDAGTVTSDPAGIDCPATVCAASFVQDEVIALTATDGGFMTFAYWIVNGGTNRYPDNPLTVTMDTAYSVTAVFSPFDGGIGTSDDPFSITTPDQLAAVDNYPDSHFRLDANISLGDWQLTPGWTPIGTPTDPFVGVFDGNCHRISELFIDRPGQDFVGFFGYLGDGAEVRNLIITDADINGYDAVGVLTGKNDGGIISACAATGTVRGHGSGTGGVGGLVGYNGWQMDNSYAAVHVTGTGDHIGGLAGKNHSGTIENCYSSGFVEGVGDIGGLVGMVYPGTVISSYWNTETSGQSSSGGGNALSSTEMRVQSNFVEWDFTNTWAVEMGDNDFPWLQCLGQMLFDLHYASGDNGSVDISYQSLRHGQDGAPVTATEDFGYAFYEWSDGSVDNPRKDLSVTRDISVAAAFAVAEYTLTYTAGANGTVTGPSPQTVNHGGDGTSVTAVADAGYHFVQWSDGSTAILRTDTNVTDNVSVAAEFAINTYKLTYTVGPHGSITGETSQTVEHGGDGTSVTAVADAGYHFVQWSDGSTASLRTETDVTDNVSVAAEFAINTYALTYTAGPHGSITGAASQTVEHGADGTSVTAVADAWYHFVQWSDGSTASLRTETDVTDNVSVTAEFAINTYALTYTAGPHGSITGEASQTVNHGGDGTSVTAVADAGYHFVQWSDGSTADLRTDTNVTDNVSVAAEFAINTYALTYTAGPHGSITGEASQTVEHGGSGTSVTAVADAGYHFVQWSDGSTAKLRTETNVTDNVSVAAEFAINTYTLTYTAGLHGSITGEASQTVEHGADGTSVTAVADEGYHFVQWSDGSTASLRTDTNVTDNISVTAEFAINTYALTYTAGLHGSITGEASQTVEHGADGTSVTAVADEGYHFVQWSDGSTASLRTDTNVTDNISVTAEFAINMHLLMVESGNGSGNYQFQQFVAIAADVPQSNMVFDQWTGDTFILANSRLPNTVAQIPDTDVSISAVYKYPENEPFTLSVNQGSGSGKYFAGEVVNVTAEPSPDGYIFKEWTGNTENLANVNLSETSFYMPSSDTELNAVYVLQEDLEYEVTVNKGTGSGSYSSGDLVFLQAAPPIEGYVFDLWTGDTENLMNVTLPETSLYMPSADIAITATYKLQGEAEHTLMVHNGAGSGSYVPGAMVDVDATIPDGQYFVQWLGQNATIFDCRAASTMIYMPFSDTTVLADLRYFNYVLTYTAGENGTIKGDGSQTVEHGAGGTAVTAEADTGYHFVQWSDESTDNARKDKNVTGDISVTAEFAINNYTLVYTSGANGAIVGENPQTVVHGGDGTSVNAVADTGYSFAQWSDGSTANPRTDVNVTEEISATAQFSRNTYSLMYYAGSHGSLSGNTSQSVYYSGSGTAVTAVPSPGYHFVQWSDGVMADQRTDSNVTRSLSVTAEFAANSYTLTYTAGPNGTIIGTSPQTVNHGKNGTSVTADPAEGYDFVRWNDASTQNPRQDKNVTGDISVTAEFSVKAYRVTIQSAAGGDLSGTTQQAVAHGGDVASVTAIPGDGYHFTGWTGDHTGAENPLDITNVTSDMQIYANFEINTYNVVFFATTGGSISGETAQIVDHGQNSQAVTAVADVGFEFTGWSGDADGMTNPLIIENITTDIYVTANFAGNMPPDVPALIHPVDNEVMAPESVVLQAGDYHDTEGDRHMQSRWQIKRCSETDIFYDFSSSVDLTAHVSEDVFENGIRYEWRVGYMDAGSQLTAWSEWGAFISGIVISDNNIPPVPPGTEISDYKLMSFVQWPVNDPFATQFNGLASAEIETDDFKAGIYNPLTGEYTEYPDFGIEPGRAYWILARNGLSLEMDGVFVSTDQDFYLPLDYDQETRNGWNMIGSPNTAYYAWYDLEIVETDGAGNIIYGPMPVSMLPENNAYIDKRIWRWEAGGYDSEGSEYYVLQPYEGAWVKARKKNITLVFPVASQAGQFARTVFTGKEMIATLFDHARPAFADNGNSDTPPMPMSLGNSSGSGGSGSGCFIKIISGLPE